MSVPPCLPAYPPFLQSFDNLTEHFGEQFADLDSLHRGRRFVDFVVRLLPELEETRGFPAPEKAAKESHDEGVDILTAVGDAGQQLFIQSRFKLRKKEEFDSIISKFQSYDANLRATPAQGMLNYEDKNDNQPSAKYMIVTSTKTELILSKYRGSQLSSRSFYDACVEHGRLSIIDGARILQELQRLYSRSFFLPSDVRLESPAGWIRHEGVHIGMVPASVIASLYERFGDGLFFENIRDFLGPESGRRSKDNRSNVNASIIETISNEPEKMLARNNGVTFRAAEVRPDGQTVVLVSGASIVNGCQTTMCLVHCGNLAPVCLVPVKVVETVDAWEVARAANYQNQVNQIDLDLARYLRPQLVQKAAGDLGYSLNDGGSTTVISILDSIHERRVDYDEVKALYLGLFSRKPNNLWSDNYTELRTDVMQHLYEINSQDDIFETLFMLVASGRKGLDECERVFQSQDYGHVFKRFHEAGRAKYRSYLAVLTICGLLRQNLSERRDGGEDEARRMTALLTNTRAEIENSPDHFGNAYMLAYQVLADVALDAMQSDAGAGEKAVLQEMHKRISDASFDGLYRKLCMRIDAADAVARSRAAEG